MPQSGSMEGAVGKDIARFQMCVDEVADPERSQALVSCTESLDVRGLRTSRDQHVETGPHTGLEYARHHCPLISYSGCLAERR